MYSILRNALRLDDLDELQLAVLKSLIFGFAGWFIIANVVAYRIGTKKKIERKDYVSLYVIVPAAITIGLLEFFVY